MAFAVLSCKAMASYLRERADPIERNRWTEDRTGSRPRARTSRS